MEKIRERRGFTIVELLIVIVVIGILAAITIVAYNGIQDKAKNASAKSAAAQLSTLLSNTGATAGSYPADLSMVNNGHSLSTSDGTTYLYHQGSGGSSYCATVTNGNHSYEISDTNPTPTPGGCPGDGQNGQAAITNLVLNPSAETDVATWEFNSDSGSIATSQSTGSAQNGTAFGRQKWTTAPSSGVTFWIAAKAQLPTSSSATYTASGYIRTSWSGESFFMNAVPYDSTGTYQGGEVYGTPTPIPANTWTRLTATITVPSGTQYVMLRLRNQAGTLPGTNATMDADAFMLTSGSQLYNYADGNSPNWIWNGTTNESASIGPQL